MTLGGQQGGAGDDACRAGLLMANGRELMLHVTRGYPVII